MEKILQNLWNNYLIEESSKIDTDEEKELAKRITELHEKANALLNKEQEKAVEKYVDSLCDIEALFTKKAFIKGCEFAVSFLLEAGNLKFNS